MRGKSSGGFSKDWGWKPDQKTQEITPTSRQPKRKRKKTKPVREFSMKLENRLHRKLDAYLRAKIGGEKSSHSKADVLLLLSAHWLLPVEVTGGWNRKSTATKIFEAANHIFGSAHEVMVKAAGNKKKIPASDVVGNDFLMSYAWRKLRYQALQLHGRRCMCCGATPETGAVLNVDHIKPRRKHPELALDINNLQVLCRDCNHGKGNWDETDFRESGCES